MRGMLPGTVLFLILAGGSSGMGWADDAYPAPVPIVLGVHHLEVPAVVGAELGLEPHQGAIVSAVYPDSAGGRMGLQRGDIIVALNDIPVVGGAVTHGGGVHAEGDTLRMIIRNQIQGDRAEVEIIRGGTRLRLGDVFTRRPADFEERPRDDSMPSWAAEAVRQFASQKRELARIRDELQDLAARIASGRAEGQPWVVRWIVSP